MSVVGLLPLVVALAVAAFVPIATTNRRIDTHLTRIARRYFSRYVTADAPERSRQLRAAYVDETYRSYTAKTYLATAVMALAGATVGVYVTGGVLLVLPAVGEFVQQLPTAISDTLGNPELEPVLTSTQVFYVVTGGGVVSGLGVAGVTYWWRLEAPKSRAEVRRRGINEGLPRTVAFVYALSRGGMPVPEVMRTLARNRAVYGHGADEISVTVREMDLFGSDVVTAVRKVAHRTPSEQFKTFSENLASVLQSGQNLPGFLRTQYERYRDDARKRQDEILELLATIAEAYVTILVAGTLFLMTILLVFGLTTTRTIGFLRLLAYVLIPLANVLFVVYLDGKLELLGVGRGTDTGALEASLSDRRGSTAVGATSSGELAENGRADDAAATGDHTDSTASTEYGDTPASPQARSDGGAATSRGDPQSPSAGSSTGEPEASDSGSTVTENRKRLALYDRFSRLKRVTKNPLETVLWNPTRLLRVTVPIAVLWIALRVPNAMAESGLRVRVLDDIVVQAFLLVVGTFAVAWELYSRRIRKMEAALPELLQRMASLNEAGMSVVESIERVRETDLGLLSAEVDRVWRDIEYGANVDDAFRRFGLRVRTTSTTRIVTLLTNALRASGSLGPVLRIAGEQAESELTLRRRRRQQMFTYLVVIYISFVVFLVIIVAVQEVLVPSLPTNVPVPSSEDTARLGVDARQFARFADVNKAAYTLVFFHTALIQAVMSGFIGGQLGEGSIKDGAKHATVMLAVAYLVFILLSSPVAQVAFSDQTMGADGVVVDSVSLSSGGFVVVHERTADGRIVGHSRYLPAGSHEDVRVPVDRAYSREMELFAAVHLDTDGDETFTVSGEAVDTPYESGGSPVYDRATVKRADSDARALRPPASG